MGRFIFRCRRKRHMIRDMIRDVSREEFGLTAL